MWLVVTFGSPCALNIASDASRMRWRVCRATWRRSGGQFRHEVDIFLHRLVLAGALELGPGFVLGGADEIEESRLVAADVAFGALLVQRVEAQQGFVVRPFRQSLD